MNLKIFKPPLLQYKPKPTTQTQVYDVDIPNAPVNEIHPFNVGIKRQSSNPNAASSANATKQNENASKNQANKRAKTTTSSNKSNVKKNKVIDDSDELMDTISTPPHSSSLLTNSINRENPNEIKQELNNDDGTSASKLVEHDKSNIDLNNENSNSLLA